MANATLDTPQKLSIQAANAIAHTGVIDSRNLPHWALRGRRIVQLQYFELQGGHVPESCRSEVLIGDGIRKIRQDRGRRNGQKLTTLGTLPPFRKPSVQPASKRTQNRKQRNVVPLR